jgi:hypothetical protein
MANILKINSADCTPTSVYCPVVFDDVERLKIPEFNMDHNPFNQFQLKI